MTRSLCPLLLLSVLVLAVDGRPKQGQRSAARNPAAATLAQKLERGIGKGSEQDKEMYLAALVSARRYQDGLRAYQRLFRSGSKKLSVKWLYYRLLRGAGPSKNKQANEALADIFKGIPRNSHYYYEIGLQVERKGEGQVAQGYYHQAIKVDPWFAPAYYRLALCSQLRGTALVYATQALAFAEPGSRLEQDVLTLLNKLRRERRD